MFKYVATSLQDTARLGAAIAKTIRQNRVFLLYGGLGFGKTTLVQAVAREMGIKDKVQSPTFNILKTYHHGAYHLCHIDAYRLEDHEEDLGFAEIVEKNTTFVEWPEFLKMNEVDQNLIVTIKINKIGEVREFLVDSLDQDFLKELEQNVHALS
ncbi:MAG: tRNA (adenosine(37)-N6)-threonylcarbamoyltransferase complex ATPase subunit type 1 TsaE [Erysipelotrichaceae bacterium]|jgi:tRNA threonylcarbamoyladenosine biosynthesis protein TsaE|nr:tRNA (adenosine(37)-N6)-threonylcarbamoyltransferase complex ATPase subunit type 1 TsaE [Erysipelotrichaceae bacterium]